MKNLFFILVFLALSVCVASSQVALTQVLGDSMSFVFDAPIPGTQGKRMVNIAYSDYSCLAWVNIGEKNEEGLSLYQPANDVLTTLIPGTWLVVFQPGTYRGSPELVDPIQRKSGLVNLDTRQEVLEAEGYSFFWHEPGHEANVFYWVDPHDEGVYLLRCFRSHGDWSFGKAARVADNLVQPAGWTLTLYNKKGKKFCLFQPQEGKEAFLFALNSKTFRARRVGTVSSPIKKLKPERRIFGLVVQAKNLKFKGEKFFAAAP